MDKYAYNLGNMYNNIVAKVGAYTLTSERPIFVGYVIMFIIAVILIGLISPLRKSK